MPDVLHCTGRVTSSLGISYWSCSHEYCITILDHLFPNLSMSSLNGPPPILNIRFPDFIAGWTHSCKCFCSHSWQDSLYNLPSGWSRTGLSTILSLSFPLKFTILGDICESTLNTGMKKHSVYTEKCPISLKIHHEMQGWARYWKINSMVVAA